MTALGRLNLRRNPFGELTRAEWAAVAVCDVAPLARTLRAPGHAVQIVAPCGRGKTTHLLALGRHLPGARYARADTDGVPHDGPWDVLLLDEADHLWPWTRWRLLGRARSVAVAVHTDHGVSLRARGFSVTTVRPSADPGRLAAVIARRIEASRRGAGPVPRVPPASVAALAARHGDDVRAVFEDLYERVTRLTEPGDVVV